MLQWQNQLIFQAEIGDSNQWGRPRGSDHRRLIVFDDNAATVPATSRSPPQGAHQSLLSDLGRFSGWPVSLHISLSRDTESPIGYWADTEEIF